MSRSLFPRPNAATGTALVLAAFLGLVGCSGRSGPAVGEVSGKVTFQGKPVAKGRVTFMNSQAGAGDDAELNPDGTYALKTPLPVGDYKVTVMPLIVRKSEGPRTPTVGVELPAPDIPEKYRNTGTSDLKATVKEGKNELNFDMKR